MIWLLLALVGAIASSAQFGGTVWPQPESPTSRVPPQAFNIRFEGGSAAEYLRAVMDASGFRNIVFNQTELEPIDVPPTHIENVTVRTALLLYTDHSLPSSRGIAELDVHLVEEVETGTMTAFRVVSEVLDRTRMIDGGDEIFSARMETMLNGEIDLEDVAGLFELGFELAGMPSGIQMRYHEPTGVLLVRGSSQQTDLAAQLLETLLDFEPEPEEGEEVHEEDEELANE